MYKAQILIRSTWNRKYADGSRNNAPSHRFSNHSFAWTQRIMYFEEFRNKIATYVPSLCFWTRPVVEYNREFIFPHLGRKCKVKALGFYYRAAV